MFGKLSGIVRRTIISTFRLRSPDKTRLDTIHLAGGKKNSTHARRIHIYNIVLSPADNADESGTDKPRTLPRKMKSFYRPVNCRYVRPLYNMA